LGNALPDQGFVEITIKDIENILHVEISKLWSNGLLDLQTEASAHFDPKKNEMKKIWQCPKSKGNRLSNGR